ncbi:hypothetical protein, partial [Clostridioides difficile]|uniref:hypothetical protein n=3 Tax=Clostridioides difficile TaxID=1496 RepID=UPI001A980458
YSFRRDIIFKKFSCISFSKTMKLYRFYMSVNREVELFKNQGGDNGEVIDIKINGLCGTSELNLYIEVKCCWNKSLESDLEEQLVKRYVLKRNLMRMPCYII